MKILITGVSGFIGKNLAACLDNTAHEIHGLDMVKPDAPPTGLHEFYQCDLSKEEDLSCLRENLDLIVHLAGEASVQSGDNVQRKNNYLGSMNLLACAKRLKAKKIIYLSSTKVGTRGAYSEMKGLVEEELKQLAEKAGLTYTILRSALVYGPGMRSNIAKWIHLLRNKGFPALPVSQSVIEMIGLEDLCRAIEICITDDRTNNKVYEISDGYPYNINEIERRSREIFRRDNPFLTVPRWSLFLLAKLGDLSCQTPLRIPVNSESYNLLFNNRENRIASFETDTGFRAAQNFLKELPVIFGK